MQCCQTEYAMHDDIRSDRMTCDLETTKNSKLRIRTPTHILYLISGISYYSYLTFYPMADQHPRYLL